jgi:signal transduction histidine kinase/CheY-like chemotaxis protein
MNYDSSLLKVLVYTPFGKDGEHLQKILQKEGLSAISYKNIDELIKEMKAFSGMLLTTDEVLLSSEAGAIAKVISEQETWSALPVMVFYSGDSPMSALRYRSKTDFQDVIYLQRPTSQAAIISAVKSALRDRDRQFKVRELLLSLKNDVSQKDSYGLEQKRQRERADHAKVAAIEASHLKSQFLANMSHEIRTPLGAIIGFLDLIKASPDATDEIAGYISIVDRNSYQLMRLIDDILDLSKVESGKMEIEKSEFSLGEFLFDFAAIMNFKAQEKGILFDLHLLTDIPARIISDSTRIRQVLLNAVGNAIKFTEYGRVQVLCSYNNSELKFVITDTGRGISEEQAEKLFQPFVQADASTTRNFGGTGLGLVLAKKICNLMGGDFRLVKSEIGTGSTFEASFLVSIDKRVNFLGQSNLSVQNKAKSSSDEKLVLKDLKILLVDDTPDNQALIKIFLGKVGAQPDVASNGREGVELATKNKYDLILMDIQMPYMGGHEATQILRKKGLQIPIIALTAHAMKEEREKTAVSGFTDILTKPVKKEVLIDTILKYTM